MMASGKKFYKRPNFITLIIALLIAAVAVPTTLALTARQAKKLDVQVEAEEIEKKDSLVWGKEVNGLRAAVEFVPEKESYDLEERVGVRFHIQNVSNEDVQFSSLSSRFDWPTVKDSDGKEVKVDGPWLSTGLVYTRRHIIKPGQILTLKTSGLSFGDFHDSALLDNPKGRFWGSVVHCGPGLYPIYYKVNRTLETGVRKVTVNERPPVDPRGFELTLDQQSMLQAVQTLRRKYRVRICFEQVGSESGRKQHLLTGTFFAPTIPELLDKLTETGLYKWEKFYRTYAVYPKQNSLLRFSVKTDISSSPLESVARVILDQDPRGKQIEIEAVYKGRMRTRLWISNASAMYALSGATARTSSNSDVVWTLTLNQGVPRLYLHRLSQAQQTNEKIKADMPDEKDQLVWGEAVEGVQCRLRAEKTIWQNGKWPKFRADLRNHGKRRLSLTVAPWSWEIELDGVWYRATVEFGRLYRALSLLPGQQETDISLQLTEPSRWRSKEENKPLAFKPGKYTVRFALRLFAADGGRLLLSVVSNPVEIEILPAEEKPDVQVEAEEVEPNNSEITVAKKRLPIHPWHRRRVENIRAETIEQTFENVANFDDAHFAQTAQSKGGFIIGTMYSEAIYVVHLFRVRRLLAEGRANPGTVVPLLKAGYEEALEAWPRAYAEEIQRELRPKSEAQLYDKVYTKALAATYLLAELQDHESLPLLVAGYKRQRRFFEELQTTAWTKVPVPTPFTLYAIHRLASTLKPERMGREALAARQAYMEWAEKNLPPPKKKVVTAWHADYDESDPYRRIVDPKGLVLVGQSKISLVQYPYTFKDGTLLQGGVGREMYITDGEREWAKLLLEFVEVACKDKPDVQVEGERAWGEAVEGLAVRLRAKGATTAKRVTLLADARNDGPGTYRGTRSTHGCWLEVDGKWYWRVKTGEIVFPMLLKAGDRQLAFTRLHLSSEKSHLWRGGISTNDGLVSPPVTLQRYQSDKPLEMTPGRHWVRLALPTTKRDGKTYAYSNQVEIQITPDGQEDQSWGKEVDGIQVRLRPDKRIWNEGDDPSFKVDMRNNGTRELETCHVASIALEVDGKAYAPRIWSQLRTIGVSPFGPGSEYTIKISCSNFSLNGKGAEELTPGKHTIRAVYLDNRDDSGIHTSLDNYDKMALAFSNPVEITIGRALPGSGLSIDEAIKEKAAFAAVCEAVRGIVPNLWITPPGVSPTLQVFKVVDVLFGKAEAVDRVQLNYKYLYKEPECERAIRKHERVIWIGHTRNMIHGSLS